MPTLKELKRQYERELREEIGAHELEAKAEGFFAKYRHAAAPYRPAAADYDRKAALAYRLYVGNEKASAVKALAAIEDQLRYEEFFLRYERQQSREISRNGERRSTPETRYRVNKIRRLNEKREKLITGTPEAFVVYHEDRLNKDLEEANRGRLIDVPYVLAARKKIAAALDAGIPVYLVGHLGSGKTQLAEEAAIDFSITRHLQSDLEAAMQDWYSHNAHAVEEEALAFFAKKYRERKAYYQDLLLNGKDCKSDRLRPLFISGSHNLTYEDMFVEKSLKLAKDLSDFPYEDYMNHMLESFLAWMQQHEKEMQKLPEEDQLQLKIQAWHTFSNLFVSAHINFGTVVEKIDREILIALKEGRPVIIDELNAIAMQNLIALNDILQRHAGSTAYVTGVGPVSIQPGFCLIGTGNLSSDTVNYEGTNALNPAFQARFITIEYNYIPQNTVGRFFEQKKPDENQLFRVIVEHLCDKRGTLIIPSPNETLDELFRLAEFARKTQDVFEGRISEVSDAEFDEQAGHFGDAPVLNEAVLSIRNIMHVLDHWNYGEEEDLSTALWEGFIGCVTNPDDLNFLLALAVRYGFFPEREGWKVRARAKGSAAATISEIRETARPYYPGRHEALSRLDVVHLLFGEEPGRSEIPHELQPWVTHDEEAALSLEAYEKLDSSLAHLEHSKDIFTYIEQNSEKHSVKEKP